MPCHRAIARRGRRARKVRNDLRTFQFSFSSISKLNTDICEEYEISLPSAKRKLYSKRLILATNTYECDDEIQHRPKATEIFVETQSDPLEQHLDDEDDAEYEIYPIQYLLQHKVVIQIDVLEAQRNARREYQQQYEPLEVRIVDEVQNFATKFQPAFAQPRIEATFASRTPE